MRLNHLWNPPIAYRDYDDNDNDDDGDDNDDDDDDDQILMLLMKLTSMLVISHPLLESHTAGCRIHGADLCCLSRSDPAKPTSPPGLDSL